MYNNHISLLLETKNSQIPHLLKIIRMEYQQVDSPGMHINNSISLQVE
jgi:hypothetical protein